MIIENRRLTVSILFVSIMEFQLMNVKLKRVLFYHLLE